MENISILLGAGFSVNQGYPFASKLNQLVLDLDAEDFYVHSDGTVIPKNRDVDDPCWYTADSKHRHFLIRLRDFYIQKEGEFNYEKFYDFYKFFSNHNNSTPEFEELCEAFRTEFQVTTDNLNLISHINKIFNQLILIFLIDKDGNQFYGSVHYGKPFYQGYTGFLNCLENLGGNNTVHIHTLNHDIFFEIFRSSDWLTDLSDGFEELGSPFYGEYQNSKLRLSHFTNNYKGTFRLYKLHGSIDQFPFHVNSEVETFIKIKKNLNPTNLFKEVLKDGKPEYINDWVNYHADFLSGTSSKILRYGERIYYREIFEHFKQNLKSAKSLLIVGYGCADTKINRLIETEFDFKNKSVIIVDPFPSDILKEFAKKVEAKIVQKSPDNLLIADILT
jgi:hypothetical protein